MLRVSPGAPEREIERAEAWTRALFDRPHLLACVATETLATVLCKQQQCGLPGLGGDGSESDSFMAMACFESLFLLFLLLLLPAPMSARLPPFSHFLIVNKTSLSPPMHLQAPARARLNGMTLTCRTCRSTRERRSSSWLTPSMSSAQCLLPAANIPCG